MEAIKPLIISPTILGASRKIQCFLQIRTFGDGQRSCGEWSLIFFGGKYSHAVLKKPRVGDFRVQEEFGGRAESVKPAATLIEQAQHIVALIPERLLFARVDAVEVDGRLWLMELELIEPALFLNSDALAPWRFAEAIASLC